MKKTVKKNTQKPIANAETFQRALFARRGGIINGISEVRRRTPHSKLEAYLKPCLQIGPYRAAIIKAPFPKSYAGIKPLRPQAPVSKELDIEWTSIILEHYLEELKEFVRLRDHYYNMMLLDEHDAALATLDEIERTLGVSIWLVGAKIAVLQASRGVTAQKEFLEALLNQSGLNIFVATVAFFLSFAAEEHVSKSELDRELDQLRAGSAPFDVTDYFRYHSNPLDLPTNPHSVVALEENAPIVDRFETFIEMAQLDVARTQNLTGKSYLATAVLRLAELPDIRIRNLCFLFTGETELLEHDAEFIDACDEYTKGNYSEARQRSYDHLYRAPRKAWWYDLAIRTSLRSPERPSPGSDRDHNFLQKILHGLTRQQSMMGDLDEGVFKLQKLMLLGRRMPSSRYLASIRDESMPLLVREDVSVSQWLWILSSPLTNPLHLKQIRSLAPEAAMIIEASLRTSVTMQMTAGAIDGLDPPDTSPLPADRISQFKGHAAFNRNEPEIAVDQYREYGANASGPDKWRALTLVHAALCKASRNVEATIELSNAYLEDSVSPRLVPLEELARWVAENQRVNHWSVHAGIILHAYSTLHGPEHDGDLSDAYENVLDFYHVQLPSELVRLENALPRPALLYYVKNICTISRMEDSTSFAEIADIENERISLLQWLIETGEGDPLEHMAEIKSITKDQAVALLSAQLERSKIYVNEEVVRRSFDAELRYSFARYRELASEPNLEIRAEAIEQRIKKLLREAEFELRDLKLPSTERDSLFGSMYLLALQEFLLYPNGGLKTYLSTRILHGALEGELRSNLARAQLLFPKEQPAGSLEFERAWADRLSNLTDDELDVARQSVLRFSSRFTDILTELINNKVRIRLSTTPEGLLAYHGSGNLSHDALKKFSEIDRYDDFVGALFDDFWRQTEIGLAGIRCEINENFAGKVEAAINALASSVESLGDGSSDLLNAVVHSRTEFLLAVERVSAWFARSGSLPETDFTLDVAIEAAVRITNNCFPSREITLVAPDTSTMNLPGKWLNPLVDLFCNCFQNAVEHGGHQEPQTINLSVDATESGLFISISNALAAHVDAERCRTRIAALLAEAKKEQWQRATEERGSGFTKMLRILKYDMHSDGSLDVAVSQEGIVSVEIMTSR